jgi:dCMP deaminase
MERISRIQLYSEIAKLMAKRATCERSQVGCVITLKGRIITTGYNSSPSGTPHCCDVGCLIEPDTGRCIRTIHAEAGAISFAARNGISLEGSSIYVTLSPCLDCAKLILNAGISSVFYGEEYRKPDGIIFLRNSGVSCTQWDI